jgi:pyruvate dehydrogenase E1 component beta subunit
MPVTPADAKGMLLASIEDDNPVIFIEHRWLHYVSGDVPTGWYTVSLDGPSRVQDGDRATVVSTSYMTLEARRAAAALAKRGCAIDLFDLRVLRPLNLASVIESVRKTGRLIVCDTGWRTLGLGAEIVAQVAEQALGDLERPPVRIALPDHPTPSALALAEVYYPGSVEIIDAVHKLCDLSEADAAAAREEVIALRQGVPIDKPDPAFKGPF